MTTYSTRRQISGAICKKAVLQAITRQEEIQRRASWEEQPTQITGAIQRARVTKPMLPLDEEGRPYYQITESYDETLALVERAVEQFHRLQGAYPAVVILSAFRYLTFGMQARYYAPEPNVRILFLYEGSSEYNVLVRGGIEDIWIR